MEATNNKYTDAKIYKIVDNGYNKCYFGSTVQSLNMRISGHRKKYIQYIGGKYNHVSVFTIFDEFGTKNCKIELVKNFSCNTREELLKREGYYISNNTCVNRHIAGRTTQESSRKYRSKNKEAIQESSKEYRNKNKDRIHASKNEQ